MYEKPINGEHEIVKKNLYLCTTFLNFPSTLLIFVFGTCLFQAVRERCVLTGALSTVRP